MIAIPPLDVLMSWPNPNYVNPATRGHSFVVVSFTLLFLVTLCVGIRLYGRIFIRRWFGYDDILIIISWLSIVGTTTTVALGLLKYDWDRHIYDMKPKTMSVGSRLLSHNLLGHEADILTPETAAGMLLYFARIWWSVASCCTRLSILCLYYRIVRQCQPEHLRTHLWVLHVMTASVVLHLLFYVGSGIFPCWPIKGFWRFPPRLSDRCYKDVLAWQINAVINTISEAVLAVLPMIGVFTLRVSRRQRWQIVSILSLGVFVTIAGIIRTIVTFKIGRTYDTSWWSTPHWICSEIEIDLAVFAACAAPLRPIIGRFLTTIKSKKTALSTKASSYTANSATKGMSYSKGSKDFDSSDDWSRSMMRAVDLEGISAEDGYGYTVQITGPRRRKQSVSDKLARATQRLAKRNDTEEVFPKGTSSSVSNGNGKMHIESTQTYEINEHYRELYPMQTRTDESLGPHDEEANIEFSSWGLLETPNDSTTDPLRHLPGSKAP